MITEMKKIIFLIMFTLLSLNKAMADNKKDYVIVEISNNMLSPSIPIKYSNFQNNKFSLKKFSKQQCFDEVLKKINNSQKFAYTYDNYIIDKTSNGVSIFLCIPFDYWLSMDENSDWNFARDKGGALLSRNMDSFISTMKSCGLDKIDDMHIPVPETPLICDKYSEENPVPVKTYEELMHED